MSGGEPDPVQEPDPPEADPDTRPLETPGPVEPRFLSRADLGESVAPHPMSTDVPFAAALKSSSGLVPFASKPPTRADWHLDAEGVPVGLPDLLDPSHRIAPAEPVSAPPSSAPTALDSEPAIPDDESVFALGDDQTDEVEDEWSAEASQELDPTQLPPAASRQTAELVALRDEVERLRTQAWMLAVAGAVTGAAATAAWFSFL